VLVDEAPKVLDAHERSGVAGKVNRRERPEDGVDGAPLEPELTEIGPREERPRSREPVGSRWAAHGVSLAVM
jgi:hypothetical protein